MLSGWFYGHILEFVANFGLFFYDSFSDEVLDQVTKWLKIQKSFKHVFNGDFAFLHVHGKSALNTSTKFAIFD